MRRFVAPPLAAALLALGGITACSAPAPGTRSGTANAAALGSLDVQRQMDALYKAAQQGRQTSVLVYGPSQNFYTAAYAAFQKRYPAIRIVAQPLFGQQLTTRLSEEFASGKHSGSVQTNGGSGIDLSSKAGQCQAYRPFTAGALTGGQSGPGDAYHAYARFAVGIEYNTDKLTKDQAPTGWRDLTAPKWKGRLVQNDPAVAGVTSLMISNLMTAGKLDRKWLAGLAANAPQTVGTAALAEQSLARGEREVMVANNSAVYTAARAKSLPVGLVFPTSEGARFDTQYVCLLKEGPNPDASKLLINWLYTSEGQNVLAQAGLYGVAPGAPAPPGLPVMDALKGREIPEVPADQQAGSLGKTLDLVRQIQP
ncbi:extracellular solute-binding protein [Actinomadura sp. NPDC048032]|uniref:ABC transporter substrate-binding protein n=1 Tax=Actinomadura sp. NPDC048032 TaxID=3155747 RepID=UPI0034027CB7